MDALNLFRSVFGRLRRRFRAYRLAEGLARFLLVGSVVVLVTFGLDWAFHLALGVRALTLALIAGVLGTVLVRQLRRLTVPATDEAFATALERAHPAFADRLISAVQFLRRRASTAPAPDIPADPLRHALEDRVIEAAATELEAASVPRLFNRKALAEQVASAALVLAVVIGLAVVFTDLFARWAERQFALSDVPWPKKTQLTVEGFGPIMVDGTERQGAIVAAGDPLDILVRVTGEIPAEREVVAYRAMGRDGSGTSFEERATGARDAPHRFLGVDRAGGNGPVGRWQFRFTVSESFEVRFEGGDDESEAFVVIAEPRPQFASVTVTVTPPAYTRRGPETLEAGQGVVRLLYGSRVDVRARTTKLLSRVSASLATGYRQDATLAPDGRTINWSCVIRANDTLSLEIADRYGFAALAPYELRLVVLPDRVPRVTVRPDGVSDRISPKARVPVVIEALDDYGISGATLYVAAIKTNASEQAHPPQAIVLALSGIDGTTGRWQRTLDIAPLGLSPGEFVSVWASASDTNALAERPGVGTSETLTFRVLARDALYAEMLQRLSDLRQRFAETYHKEKELARLFAGWQGDLADPAAPDDAHRRRVASFAARQRRVTTTDDAIARQYLALLREMKFNNLLNASLFEEQRDRVTDPLARVVKARLKPLTAQLRAYVLAGRGGDAPKAPAAVTANFQAALKQMEAIREAMFKVESFAETVRALEAVLRAHEEATNRTEEARDAARNEETNPVPPPGDGR